MPFGQSTSGCSAARTASISRRLKARYNAWIVSRGVIQSFRPRSFPDDQPASGYDAGPELGGTEPLAKHDAVSVYGANAEFPHAPDFAPDRLNDLHSGGLDSLELSVRIVDNKVCEI